MELQRQRGACGENGEESHGGTWDDASENVNDCARQAGFRSDSPEPSTTNTSKVSISPYWPLILLIPFPGNPVYGGL